MKGKILFMCLLLATAVYSPQYSKKAYAYTLKDLETYIDNPDFHSNQSGRAGYNVGMDSIVGTTVPVTNVNAIYFDSSNKSFQILARVYNPNKGIDKTSKDMKWSVVDDRICTVDSNGKVTAGNMTGTTIIIMEDDDYCINIPVVNITGKYDSWYEDMFKNIKTYYYRYKKSDFKYSSSARKACEFLGNAYKIITDAYMTYGNSLKSDPEVRFEVLKEAIQTATTIPMLLTADGHSFGDCSEVTKFTSLICEVFKSKTDRCGSTQIYYPTHVCNIVLIDGVIYMVDNGNFYEISKESDWTWKNGKLTGTVDNNKLAITCEKDGSFKDDSEYMAHTFENGVYND